MTVYVDSPRTYTGRGRMSGQWSHLWADNVEELHALARRIRLRRDWFQQHPRFPHYDVRPSRRAAALRAGAVPREFADWLRNGGATRLG